MGLVLALLAACGSSVGSNGASNGASGPLSGHLDVLAAASLTETFDDLKTTLASASPDLSLTFTYAGSQALVQQIQDGAPADVLASADERTMQVLIDAGLVEGPAIFAGNELEIAVAAGNPKHIGGVRDLARADIVVVLDDPAVPAGNYTRQVLAKAGVRVKAKSLELDVKSALARVTSGEADATIVYATDVEAAAGKADGVAIPASENVVARYPMAVVRASNHRAAARAFVRAVLSRDGQRVLRRHGFLAPPAADK